jgi:hypothetical protein
MKTVWSSFGSLDDPAARKGALRRHYIIFQAAVWSLFFIISVVGFLQLQWPDLKPDAYARIHPAEFILGKYLFPVVAAFLLTHFSRRFLNAWGWKRLDWGALMPRILAAGLVLTLFLMGFVFGLNHWLQLPAAKIKSVPIFLVTWFANSLLFDGWLGAYFLYHLFERINRLENERLSLVASQKEAEFRALKSQVNPHFIFNSLNSLRSLIDEEPSRARLAVTQLANLLRYSLQSSQLETVPLEEELRVTSDYLALEQVRYEERLQLRIDVAPETLALPVPPMLLQTLVENAIKYGIGQRREGGEVAIIARCEGAVLRLQVTNPSAPDASPQTSAESTGVGLRNAAHRLRLLFGESATLQLRTDIPNLVVAEVVMPLRLSPSRSA